MSNRYQRDMAPWSALESNARMIPLPGAPDRKMFLYEAGAADAPAVVLIHGLADEADTWRHVMLLLAERYRVVALDLPGFGRSDLPAKGYGIHYLAALVREVMNQLSIPRATLVGSSLGAIIAHMIAVRWTMRVAGLVLVDGGLALEPQKLQLKTLVGMLPFIGENWYNGLRKDPQKTYATLRPYYADIDRLPEDDRVFLYQRVNERVWNDRQRSAYFGILRRLPLFMLRDVRRYTQKLASLSVDTLVIWGENDRILAPSNGQALLRAQPSAHLSIIPNAGHLPHQEQPAAFLAALEKFGL
jgi:pimeloyl-ACP methyl ester carboxylesterase